MHPALEVREHRPWPVPDRNWRWRQVWTDLTFIHWEIRPADIAPWVPEGLELDLFDGTAWIGVVPFDSKSFTQRPLPALPDAVHLPELNVRTYVTLDGKPGVWFLSLDISSSIAVLGARSLFFLPYFRAKMSIDVEDDSVRFASERKSGEEPRKFEASYQRLAQQPLPEDAFHRWAVERYCLYSEDAHGNLHRADIHHRPWPLESAEMEITTNSYLDGLQVGPMHPDVLFSKEQETLIWPPRMVRKAGE